MARGRGGGGGGSGGFDSGGSSGNDGPKLVEIVYMYGHLFQSLWSQSQLMAQLVLAVIWGIISVGFLYCTIKLSKKPKDAPKTKVSKWIRWLGLGFLCLLASFALQATRFGLLHDDISVPKSFRLESVFTNLLFNFAIFTIFVSLYSLLDATRRAAEGDTKKPRSFVFRTVKAGLLVFLLVFLGLVVAYFIFDLMLALDAMKDFHEWYGWRLADRDFSLTLSSENILRVKQNAVGETFSPGRVEDHWYAESDEKWGGLRTRQIKIQIALNIIGLMLSIIFIPVWIVNLLKARIGSKGTMTPYYAVAILTLPALIFHFIYKTVIAVHYVSHNWKVVSDLGNWNVWILNDNGANYESMDPSNPNVFLAGYRKTVKGFSIVDGILGPLPVLIAGLGLLLVGRSLRRIVRSKHVV